MDINIIYQTVAAIFLVILIHELGHLPKKIKWSLNPFKFIAVDAKYRYGGLFVNLLIILFVFYTKPELIFFQIVGLISFIHFVLYLILGSLLPEKMAKTMDDVPNKYAFFAISLATLSVVIFRLYFYEILLRLYL